MENPHVDPLMTDEHLCRPIRLILSDVDGVLTDGGLIFGNEGTELKQFHIRDGMGIRLWQRAGHEFGMITGRTSRIVEKRAAELGVEIVRQGRDDKLPVLFDVLAQQGVTADQTCYIGDDLPDLALVRHVGLGVAVADAAAELRAAAAYVTQLPGGRGAVREVVEMVLKSQGCWNDVVGSLG
jgi:YrbI family 3-deoxy-D-manno-octulosonate 8-phosphate phosphatase